MAEERRDSWCFWTLMPTKRRRPPLPKPAVTVREWMESDRWLKHRTAAVDNGSAAQPVAGEEQHHQPSQHGELHGASASSATSTTTTEKLPSEPRVYVGMGPRRKPAVAAPPQATPATSPTGLPLPDPRGFRPLSITQRARRMRGDVTFFYPPPPPRKRRVLALETPPPPDVDVDTTNTAVQSDADAANTHTAPSPDGTEAAGDPPLGSDYSALFAWLAEFCKREEDSVVKVAFGAPPHMFYSAEQRRAAKINGRSCVSPFICVSVCGNTCTSLM